MMKQLAKLVLAVLVMTVAATSAADARKRGYYYGYFAREDFKRQDDGEGRERRGEQQERFAQEQERRAQERQAQMQQMQWQRGGAASFGAIVDEVARGCRAQAAELKGWPFERIAETVSADAEQRRALDALREAALATADKLAAECPAPALPAAALRREDARERAYGREDWRERAYGREDARERAYGGRRGYWRGDPRAQSRDGWTNPPAPGAPSPPATTGRNEAPDPRDGAKSIPEARLDAAEGAIEAVTAALTAVERPLRDFYAALDDEQKARLIRGLGNEAAERNGERRRWRPSAESVGVPWGGICERLTPALRDWPKRGLEHAMRLSDAQKVVLYELYATALKAADTLGSACPADNALTPLRRMELLRTRLAAVRDATTAIRPALMRFHDALDGPQQQRFAQMN